jgi:hypothetical protein
VKPSSTIEAPTARTTLGRGAAIAVSGRATDAGGGAVAGVEVSLDGGATWHPARGRERWSYEGRVPASGPVALRSRAVDDSGNLEQPRGGVELTVQ